MAMRATSGSSSQPGAESRPASVPADDRIARRPATSGPILRKSVLLALGFVAKKVEFSRCSITIHLTVPTLLVKIENPSSDLGKFVRAKLLDLLFNLLYAAHTLILDLLAPERFKVSQHRLRIPPRHPKGRHGRIWRPPSARDPGGQQGDELFVRSRRRSRNPRRYDRPGG
jgi:hypothetical protein